MRQHGVECVGSALKAWKRLLTHRLSASLSSNSDSWATPNSLIASSTNALLFFRIFRMSRRLFFPFPGLWTDTSFFRHVGHELDSNTHGKMQFVQKKVLHAHDNSTTPPPTPALSIHTTHTSESEAADEDCESEDVWDCEDWDEDEEVEVDEEDEDEDIFWPGLELRVGCVDSSGIRTDGCMVAVDEWYGLVG